MGGTAKKNTLYIGGWWLRSNECRGTWRGQRIMGWEQQIEENDSFRWRLHRWKIGKTSIPRHSADIQSALQEFKIIHKNLSFFLTNIALSKRFRTKTIDFFCLYFIHGLTRWTLDTSAGTETLQNLSTSLYYIILNMRQCQIRVRFESRVKTKFLQPLYQILKLNF